jgi:magnesium-transporting ATPase (P-type)
MLNPCLLSSLLLLYKSLNNDRSQYFNFYFIFESLQATLEQFRRFANLYFLIVGAIMAVGYYSELFESAISPWTTLGPLSIVISFSLLVEGTADLRRHKSDEETNNSPCVILRRADELDADEDAERDKTVMNGKDVLVNLSKAYFQTSNNQQPETPVNRTSSELVGVAFQKIRRMNIRQGHLVLIKNRDMIPADMILLASSGDSGSSYIETSSIDGETNLKLRTSPNLPKKLLKCLRDGVPMDAITEEPEDSGPSEIETLEQAAKRVTRFSCLANPEGISALENPNYDGDAVEEHPSEKVTGTKLNIFQSMDAGLQAVKGMMTESTRSPSGRGSASNSSNSCGIGHKYVAALTTEPPNPHVNTFSGKLTLPPVEIDGSCYDIPLGAENILLRGAVLRNTEWAIGLACFTGTDTKLVQNSFETPSKFSQLDRLMNWTVIAVICVMILCISYLATQAVISNDQKFDNLWYVHVNETR